MFSDHHRTRTSRKSLSILFMNSNIVSITQCCSQCYIIFYLIQSGLVSKKFQRQLLLCFKKVRASINWLVSLVLHGNPVNGKNIFCQILDNYSAYFRLQSLHANKVLILQSRRDGMIIAYCHAITFNPAGVTWYHSFRLISPLIC